MRRCLSLCCGCTVGGFRITAAGSSIDNSLSFVHGRDFAFLFRTFCLLVCGGLPMRT